MVKALASHQCGPGSNPGVDTICGLSLLLVLSLAPRGFSPGTPVFPSPQKPAFPNSNSTRNQVDEEPLYGYATCKSLFINLFVYVCLGTPVRLHRSFRGGGGFSDNLGGLPRESRLHLRTAVSNLLITLSTSAD